MASLAISGASRKPPSVTMPATLGMAAVLEHGDRVQVLARRDIAQREGLAHHRAGLGTERMHVLDELVAQAFLVEGRAQRRRADRLELGARLRFQPSHCGPPN
jgi:hypothetical protein